ncbi:unnamed protein product [Rotaria socialis]|uniref:Uncharacterized protein n=2 Tax=Rotaria socialis TaxID=392032 RepID=A0A818EJ35_9BILA|nr:unnamed protein product [Rotaria socialis]
MMRRGANMNCSFNNESSLTNQQLNNNHSMINTKHKRRGKTTTDINDTTSEYNLEEMIDFIRQNPTTALDVHRHLTQAAQRINPNFNLPIESSTLQTPKRNLDTSENDDVQVLK